MSEHSFGKRLQDVVNIMGSIAALSRKASISASTIKGYIEETNDPTRKKLIAMAEAAKVSVEWLATGDGTMLPGEKVERQQEIKKEKCSCEAYKLNGKGHLFEKDPGFDPELMGKIYAQLSVIKDKNPDFLTKEKEIDVLTLTYSLCQPAIRNEAKLICSIVSAIINEE